MRIDDHKLTFHRDGTVSIRVDLSTAYAMAVSTWIAEGDKAEQYEKEGSPATAELFRDSEDNMRRMIGEIRHKIGKTD